ncbi:hypothetical protein JCM10296v2_003722 [Rhodotorula toruloides]
MGCWIAESTHTREAHVPGTSLLDDLKASPATQEQSTHLKRDKNGIVLVPQPSDDPRDPLNWPTWKRELAYWNIVFATSLVGAIGPLIAPGFVQIAKEFQVSVNNVAGTNAALVLAIGAAMIPVSTVAIKWGRRPVYIWGAAFLLAGSIWSAAKPDLDNLLASRVIQGLGMAPVESTATATIGDLFPVHQRGMRVAVWGLSLLGGINLAPIVAGTIISTIGWQYCFWTIVPFFALSLVFMILFLPETAYDRAPIANSLSTSTGDIDASEDEKDEKGFSEQVEDVNAIEKQDGYLPAKTVWQEVLPWSGYVDKDPIWKIFLRPFLMLFSPATFWSLVAGYVADFLATFMARRNKGVFEPEMRLLLMIPYAVLVIAGYVGWAVSYRNHDHWLVPVIMYGFVNAGQKFLSTASVTYIIDVHREQTSEVQAAVNFLSIGTEINGWVVGLGIEQTFYVLAGISAGIALTTIPMYHYGKRCRAWVSRNQKLFAL